MYLNHTARVILVDNCKQQCVLCLIDCGRINCSCLMIFIPAGVFASFANQRIRTRIWMLPLKLRSLRQQIMEGTGSRHRTHQSCFLICTKVWGGSVIDNVHLVLMLYLGIHWRGIVKDLAVVKVIGTRCYELVHWCLISIIGILKIYIWEINPSPDWREICPIPSNHVLNPLHHLRTTLNGLLSEELRLGSLISLILFLFVVLRGLCFIVLEAPTAFHYVNNYSIN